jgi:hypothetical protein
MVSDFMNAFEMIHFLQVYPQDVNAEIAFTA